MRKLMCLAALAACVSTPALAQEVRFKADGLTTEQIYAQIVDAAETVCRKVSRRDQLSVYAKPACVRGTVRRTVNETGDARLIAYHREQRAPAMLLAKLGL